MRASISLFNFFESTRMSSFKAILRTLASIYQDHKEWYHPYSLRIRQDGIHSAIRTLECYHNKMVPPTFL